MSNRIIKFRAWDIDKCVLIPTDVYGIITTDFSAFGVMLKEWENYREGEYFYKNTQIVEQFTGLTDKNGREVFEGDIFRPSMYRQGVVMYVDYRFRVKFGREFVSLSPSVCKNGSVLGNVHENPELI